MDTVKSTIQLLSASFLIVTIVCILDYYQKKFDCEWAMGNCYYCTKNSNIKIIDHMLKSWRYNRLRQGQLVIP